MQLAGNQMLPAPPSQIWAMLMDPDVLAKVVPGISSLEKISDTTFKSTLTLKIGPVGGSFTGNLQLEDLITEKGFTLKAQQNSKVGNANATVHITLEPSVDLHTALDFNGDVKLSGVLATMGQRVLGGVANTLTKQFFANLEKQIAAAHHGDNQ